MIKIHSFHSYIRIVYIYSCINTCHLFECWRVSWQPTLPISLALNQHKYHPTFPTYITTSKTAFYFRLKTQLAECSLLYRLMHWYIDILILLVEKQEKYAYEACWELHFYNTSKYVFDLKIILFLSFWSYFINCRISPYYICTCVSRNHIKNHTLVKSTF